MRSHLSVRPTWISPGRVVDPAWACTGRGLASRRVTATLVRSYRTVSPLPVRASRAGRAIGGLSLCHFPAGFPGSALPTVLALRCPDFPREIPPATAWPAPPILRRGSSLLARLGVQSPGSTRRGTARLSGRAPSRLLGDQLALRSARAAPTAAWPPRAARAAR